MAADSLGERERRRLASRLADDLREVVAHLGEREISDADLVAAANLGDALCAHVKGPARARWYERDATDLDPSDRFAYLDQSPIRGRLNPIAPPMRIDVVAGDDGVPRVAGHARLGSAYEGPPHGVHGGWVAAMMDELLGTVQGLAERQGVTATLKVRFRHVTPLDEDLRFAGWVHEDRGRILVARGTCHAGDTLTADAEGIFVRVDFGEIQQRMRGRRDGA